jgi:hypothetical protein
VALELRRNGYLDARALLGGYEALKKAGLG